MATTVSNDEFRELLEKVFDISDNKRPVSTSVFATNGLVSVRRNWYQHKGEPVVEGLCYVSRVVPAAEDEGTRGMVDIPNLLAIALEETIAQTGVRWVTVGFWDKDGQWCSYDTKYRRESRGTTA